MALGANSVGAAVIGIAVLAAAAASGSVVDSAPAIGREGGGGEQGLAPPATPADGRVSFAGWSGGYGRQVRIGHADGLATSYSHMSRIAAVPGALVRRGDIIGFVGSSGLSTGAHLHYEVFRNGRPVDPGSVRAIGGGDALDSQERRAFNATLRQLLTASNSGG